MKRWPGRIVLALTIGLFPAGPSDVCVAGEVVVYTSVDEILSARVFKMIEKRTGLDVLPVYDTEATKTTGLYLRILQERSNPRADVFWNSEFSRTLLLEEEGLLKPYLAETAITIPKRFRDSRGYWTGFSLRARVVAYNEDLVRPQEVPRRWEELADPRWSGRIAWANPLFGTTATHCGALLSLLGEKSFESTMTRWSERFRRVAGNGPAAQLVARGAIPLALTDTDDVWRLRLEGKPIGMVPFDEAGEGTLLIPNTVAILEDSPHPKEAPKFVDALLSMEIEEFLAASTSRQIPVRDEVAVPKDLEPWRGIKSIDIDYGEIAKNIDPAMRRLRRILAN